MLHMLVSAFLIGVAVSAPIGAFMIAVSKRAVIQGFKPALMFTLGSIVGDTIYAMLAYLGLAPLLNSSDVIRLVLWFVGGAWLCWLGWDAMQTRIDDSALGGQVAHESHRQSFVAGFGLTMFNPMAIAGWIAIGGSFFAGWDTSWLPLYPFGALALVSMLMGALFYAIAYVAILSRVRHFISPRFLTMASIGAGIFLIVFGIGAWWSAGEIVLAIIIR